MSPWEDGAKVQFTDEFRERMSDRVSGRRLHEALGVADPHGVYTVSNDIPHPSLHDVVLIELGRTFGVGWLSAIDQPVRNARQHLSSAQSILDTLHLSEEYRSNLNDALFSADSSIRADKDKRDFVGPDIAAALRLAHAPLRSEIMTWTCIVMAREEALGRAIDAFKRDWPDYTDLVKETN